MVMKIALFSSKSYDAEYFTAPHVTGVLPQQHTLNRQDCHRRHPEDEQHHRQRYRGREYSEQQHQRRNHEKRRQYTRSRKILQTPLALGPV